MEDKFDKILGNKIRESVNSMEFSYNPEHWNKLKAKKAKKKKKKKVFLYWKIAGILVLALIVGSIGKFLIQNTNTKNEMRPQIIFDKSNDSLRLDSLKNNKNIFITSGNIDSIQNTNSKFTAIDSVNKNRIYKQKPDELLAGTIRSEKSILINTDSNFIKKGSKKKKEVRIYTKYADLNESIFEKNMLTELYIGSTKKKILNNEEKESVSPQNIFVKEDISLVLNEDILKSFNERKTVQLGIAMAPVLSNDNSEGNSNVGFSGGVAIDLPMSKRFDINLGVYYTDQKLNLQNSNAIVSGVRSRSSSQLIFKEAILKGIEIPLNVKYNFSIDQKKLFVLVGFSSTSYIKESIEANYIVNNRTETRTQDYNGNNIVQYVLIQNKEKISTPSNSSNFNLGNILNLSFGIEFPLNKNRQSIIIEPYFKHLLSPVTNQKFKFSSGGMNLRYNFNFFTKK